MGRVMMDCPRHGLLAVEGVISGIGEFETYGSLVTCPEPGCGKMGPILDGIYRPRDLLGLSTLYTPTPAARKRIETVLAWAQAEMDRPDADASKVAKAAASTIEREAPGVWEKIKHVVSSSFFTGSVNLAVFLLTLLQMFLSAQGGISAEQLEEILDRVYDEQQNQQTGTERDPGDFMPVVPPPDAQNDGEVSDA